MMKHVLLAGVCMALPARAHASLEGFDATKVTPDAGFDPLPAGWYNVAIDESELKPTTAGDGTYLKLRFTVLDGQYQGRKLFFQCNLKNPSAQAVEIGQKQLSAVCHAVGVLRPQDSSELHDKPLKVKVKYKPAQGQYSEGNDITSFKSKDEKVDMAGGDANHAGAAAFGAGAPAANPWENGAASGMAGAPTPSEAPQPWAAGGQPAAPAAPPPPAAPEAPAAPAAPHDPLAAAVADGWIKHPSAPGYHYKGQDVKLDADVAAMYPAPAVPAAPAAPPAPPAAPEVPAAPAGDADAAQTAPPPWAQPK